MKLIHTILLITTFVSAVAQEFDSSIDIAKVVDVDAVKKQLVQENKPGLVFVTQPWCGACKGLKKSINGDQAFKDMLKEFVVVHASGEDGAQWQADGQNDGYIPRVYFLDAKGNMQDITAPNPKYAYLFPSSEAVKKGMETLLSNHKESL